MEEQRIDYSIKIKDEEIISIQEGKEVSRSTIEKVTNKELVLKKLRSDL